MNPAARPAAAPVPRPRHESRWHWLARATVLSWLALTGCDRPPPPGSLVVTQVPQAAKHELPRGEGNTARTWLDLRYPVGSRVVVVSAGDEPKRLRPTHEQLSHLISAPYSTPRVRVLSRGLAAAGSPLVAPDGRRVFFVGKGDKDGDWQIYQVDLGGGRPAPVTDLPGGAMEPALLANGELVYSSPVPRADHSWATASPTPALYAQRIGGRPHRLTHGAAAAMDPTVLQDGRILFVSVKPRATPTGPVTLGLYTISNDGTEVTAFAVDRDGAPFIRRPRELADGRVGFLASEAEMHGLEGRSEVVSLVSPFATRTPLMESDLRCNALEAGLEGTTLVCGRSLDHLSYDGPFVVYQNDLTAPPPGNWKTIAWDPGFDEREAVALVVRPKPLGHLSAMAPEKTTGTLLCLDANFARDRRPDGSPLKPATRVRVLAATADGRSESLGEIPLQPDGSFMAEVPADVPLGFETLTADGDVVHRLPPSLWVRAGENRSCVGCHEPYHRSPRNQRPLAVNTPATPLRLPPSAVAPSHP